MPGGGRQWNKSAGKEREKTGKRASETRHGGTGGERRAAPVTRRSGCHALRGLTGPGATWARGDALSSPRSISAGCLPQTLSSPQPHGKGQGRDDLLRPNDTDEAVAVVNGQTGTTGSVAASRSRAASTRTGGRRVRRTGGDSKKRRMEGGGLRSGGAGDTRREKQQQTGRKTEEETGRAGVEERTYLIWSMPCLWRS